MTLFVSGFAARVLFSVPTWSPTNAFTLAKDLTSANTATKDSHNRREEINMSRLANTELSATIVHNTIHRCLWNKREEDTTMDKLANTELSATTIHSKFCQIITPFIDVYGTTEKKKPRRATMESSAATIHGKFCQAITPFIDFYEKQKRRNQQEETYKSIKASF